MVWFVCWMLFVYNSPSVHPCIKEREKNYIIAALAVSAPKGEVGRGIRENWTPNDINRIRSNMIVLVILVKFFQLQDQKSNKNNHQTVQLAHVVKPVYTMKSDYSLFNTL